VCLCACVCVLGAICEKWIYTYICFICESAKANLGICMLMRVSVDVCFHYNAYLCLHVLLCFCGHQLLLQSELCLRMILNIVLFYIYV